VQWRIEGRRKTKTFETVEKQIGFAKTLAGDAKQNGLAAFRLDEGEVREWRAFRAMVGPDADLAAVAACWERNKANNAVALTVTAAVAEYTAAKKAEGVDAASIAHYKPIFDRLEKVMGDRLVGTITRQDVTEFMAAQEGSASTLDTRFRRVRALFNWLVENDKLDRTPFKGKKPPKVKAKDVEILTLKQSQLLFSKNAKNEDGRPIDQARRELLGRLALEAFAGLRYSTACQIVASEIEPGGLRIPAAKIKTRLVQFLEGLPSNLHAWLKWSQPENWTMTQRQYLEAKISAFTRADVPHPRNCLRHGFASYHVAAFKDTKRTSLIMCHKSADMLWDTYKTAANERDGVAYFKIMPPTKESAQ
jgi:site-specific recombinase XerC